MRTKRDRGSSTTGATRSVALLSLLLLIATMAAPVSAGEAAELSRSDVTSSIRQASNVHLASDVLRSAVDQFERGEIPRSLESAGDLVRVEVLYDGAPDHVRRLVEERGGLVTGSVGGTLMEALVPLGELESLEGELSVRYLRTPIVASFPVSDPAGWSPGAALDIVGEEVSKIGADDWHAAGYTGSGVKVGIIDGFNGDLWSAAQAAGEVPAVPDHHTYCSFGGAPCSLSFWTTGSSPHGVAVAEIIHELAPNAELFLATNRYPYRDYTAADMQAAVDFFGANGVSLISHSATAEFDGPGDGTGPLADVVDSAVGQGMAWFNSAGNTAGNAVYDGAYWRGPWQDADGDAWLEFTGSQEYIEFDSCGFVSGVRWSDWGEAGATDYDVMVIDELNDLGNVDNAVVISAFDQTVGADPVEYLYEKLRETDHRGDCAQNEERRDYIQIQLYAAGAGVSDDIIEIRVNGSYLDPSTNEYSAAGPYADSANPGALAVGAIDPPMGTTAGYYSAWGPTNDGRTKPDLVAASGMLSFAYQSEGDGRFHGTSAAAPAVAGAAALVIDAGVAATPAQLKSYLLSEAVSDRGPAGPDNQYGYGELILPAPPEPAPTLEIDEPASGATVADTITITASSTGTVSGVEFAIDGVSLGTDWNGADGWSQSWDTTQHADGSHAVSVVAVNDARAHDAVTVTVDNDVPPPATLTITEPVLGSVVSDTVKVAAVSTGDVTAVQFDFDGILILTDTDPSDGWDVWWATTNFDDGPVSITATAVNNPGVSDSISVMVNNSIQRTVTITSPLAGAVVSDIVPIAAQSTGSIDGIRFEVDGSVLGYDFTAGDGWKTWWDTSAYDDGPHTITARATNDATVSDSIAVTVDNPDPVVLCKGLVATIVGTNGDDFLYGTPNNDVIHGLGGRDSISGYGGDDVICGGDGEDFLYGGPGNDILYGQAGHDNLNGDDGDDTLFGGAHDDYLSGGAGNDLLRGQLGDDWSWGEDGDDKIQDGPGDDGLDGGEGKDKLWGGMGNDVLWGDDGRDQLHGGRDNDTLYGNLDTDRIWGDSGDDTLGGGDNSDFLYGGIGDDELWGNAGNDRLFGQAGNDDLWGGPGKDQLRGQTGDDTNNGGPHFDWCSVETTPSLYCEKALY